MAKILLHLMRIKKGVVPFLVVDKEKCDRVLNTGQVRFMIECKEWLRKENVLTWGYIERLRNGASQMAPGH